MLQELLGEDSKLTRGDLKDRLQDAQSAVSQMLIHGLAPLDFKKKRYKLIYEFELCQSVINGFVTLDYVFCFKILDVVQSIVSYFHDNTRKRPHNFLLMAPPGSGKSHFVECLARCLESERLACVSYNMAGFDTLDDLNVAISSVRNHKVEDKRTILFIDEFDSKISKLSILLPLLWDGELQISERSMKLGKIVICLAGSTPLVREFIAKGQDGLSLAEKDIIGKLPDLISRIGGGIIKFPEFEHDWNSECVMVDRAMLFVALLDRRFNRVLKTVPYQMFWFIAQCHFSYSARSIAHIVNMLPRESLHERTIIIGRDNLPFSSETELSGSALRFHFPDEAKARDAVANWNKSFELDVQITIRK